MEEGKISYMGKEIQGHKQVGTDGWKVGTNIKNVNNKRLMRERRIRLAKEGEG